MPPTRAAASSTPSGRCSSNQRSTARWSRRSTASRPTVRIRHSSCASRRRSAEPTMPQWPATKTRRPLSGKRVGGSMLSIASCDRGAPGRVGKPGLAHGALPPGQVDIVLDHRLYKVRECDPRLPAEDLTRLRCIAAQYIDFGRPEIAPVDLDMAPPVKAGRRKSELDEIPHTVRLPSGDDVVIGVLLLQHQPHRLDIISGKAPVTLRSEISQVELVLQAPADPADRPGHFPRHEGFAATRALMIE